MTKKGIILGILLLMIAIISSLIIFYLYQKEQISTQNISINSLTHGHKLKQIHRYLLE